MRAKILLAITLLHFSAFRVAAEPQALSIGIMPFNSTLALFKIHQPIRLQLQEALGRPVELFTAPDYPSYLKDCLAGRFDLLIAGPHLGVMSMESGYQPMLQYKTRLQPVIVVKKGAPINNINDLKGKRVGLPSSLSVSSIAGIKWIQDHGLKIGTDITLIEESSHGSAVAAVAVGTLDATLTTHTPLKQMPKDVLDQVDIFPSDVQTSHLMTLANKRLGSKEIERIRTALLALQNLPAGQAFFESTGYLGYEPVSNTDIANMQPYIAITRNVLNTKSLPSP